MVDHPPAHDERYKAEMPQIPGVGSTNGKRANGLPIPAMVIGGLVVVAFAVVAIGKMITRPHRAAPPVDPPLVEVSEPDLGNAPPQVPPPNRGIATVNELAKAWSSVQFDYRDPSSGERFPALLVRLPAGSGSQPGSYWAMNLKASYNSCQLEYVSDLQKLRKDYGYGSAKHPMVGNPCSRTLFDPLKMTNLPGNIWVRGAIAQGSDLRPPLGIEIKIQGKDIFAVRME
jgi:hypothetical protein